MPVNGASTARLLPAPRRRQHHIGASDIDRPRYRQGRRIRQRKAAVVRREASEIGNDVREWQLDQGRGPARKRRGGNDADAALADVSGGDEVDGCTAQRRIDREVAARPRRRERHIVRAGIERTRFRKAFGVVQRERAVRGREAAEIDERITLR